MNQLIKDYKIEIDKRCGEPQWAVHKRYEQTKLVSCTVPFVGKNYFEQGKKVLVYASAEVLSDYYPGSEVTKGYWLDDDIIAIDRHRWFFENNEFQVNGNEMTFFPNVHIQPMNDGSLPVAFAYILATLGITIDEAPKNFYERMAFGNYGKYTIETDFQAFFRLKGKADVTKSKANKDYADNKSYLEASHDFVEIDIKHLRPDFIIMPHSMYAIDKDFINQIKGSAKIIPIMQMNAGNINRQIRGKYPLLEWDDIDDTVRNWYDELHDNGITGQTKINYRYVFGYLKSVLMNLDLL